MHNKDYYVLRYSLVEETQLSLHAVPLPKTKGHAVLPGISTDREQKINGIMYSVLKFKTLAPSHGYDYPTGRFFLGKIAKLKKQQTGEKVPGDIVEFEHDNWIPITLVFDIDTQHIFVQRDWRFGDIEHIARTLQLLLSKPILSEYNHRIFIEGKSETSNFWNVVSDKQKIFKLEFKLISPNILDTNRKARDALASLKEIFGQEEIDITLKNDSGELKIPEAAVSNYLEYIAEGEGSWKVVTEGERGGKKEHSSQQNTDIVSLPALDIGNQADNQLELGQEKAIDEPKTFAEANLGAEVYATIKNMGKN